MVSRGVRPTILTKDGDERLYRAQFPVVSATDPLVQAHGRAEFWRLDRSRVSISVVAAEACK